MAVNVNEIDDFDEFDMNDSYDNSQIDYEDETDDGQYSDDYEDGGYYQTSLEMEDNSDDDDTGVIEQLLLGKGIDPNSVKIQNVYGEVENVKFDDLSKEEQLQILNYNDADDNYGLADHEVGLVNYLRYHNLSIEDYNNLIAQQAINGYIQQQGGNEPSFEVDYISDDELFLLDLKSRIPDISDDEAWEELEQAKQNEDLYDKKIYSLRDEYKQKESLIQEQEQQKIAHQQQMQAQQLENAIVNAIQQQDVIDLGDSQLSLSVDDKNEIASFILDSDATGVRYITKALNDPATVVKMAWYALKGEDAFSQITDYYKQEISKAARYNYAKGYEDAKKGHVANSAKVVVKRPSSKRENKPLTINDID